MPMADLPKANPVSICACFPALKKVTLEREVRAVGV